MRIAWAVAALLGAVGLVYAVVIVTSEGGEPVRLTTDEGASPFPNVGPGLRSQGTRARPKERALPDPATVWIRQLTGEAGAHARAALRKRFEAGTLIPSQMLDIVLVPGLTGDAEAFRERVYGRLERLEEKLRPLSRRVLELCLHDAGAHRKIAAKLLAAALADISIERQIASRLNSLDDVRLAEPSLGPADLALVTQVLRDARTTPGVKHTLLSNLGLLGPEAMSLLPDALRYVEDVWARRQETQHKNPRTRYHWRSNDYEVARGLGMLGVAATPQLIALLADDRRDMAGIASYALQHMGAAAVPALLEAARDANPVLRERALDALAETEVQSPAVLEALRSALRDDVESIRREAAGALVSQGAAAHEDIIRALDEPGPARAKVLYELAWGGVYDAVAPPLHAALLRRLKDAGAQERRLHPAIAVDMGPAAAPATRELLRLIAEQPNMSSPRPKELIQVLGVAAGPHLLATLQAGDRALLPWAAKGLLWMETVDRETQRGLVEWLDAHPGSSHALSVAAAAATLGSRAVTGILLRGLEEQRWADRAAAATGLGRMGKAAMPHLGRIAELLAALDVAHRDTMPSLPSARLHVAIAGALAGIGRHDVGALLDLMDHDNGEVRKAALEALQKHEPRRATDLTFERWSKMTARQHGTAVRLLVCQYTFWNTRTLPLIRSAFEDPALGVRVHVAGGLLRHASSAGDRTKAVDLLVQTYAAYPQPEGYLAYVQLTSAHEYARAKEIVAAVERALPGADAKTAKRLRTFAIDIENR